MKRPDQEEGIADRFDSYDESDYKDSQCQNILQQGESAFVSSAGVLHTPDYAGRGLTDQEKDQACHNLCFG